VRGNLFFSKNWEVRSKEPIFDEQMKSIKKKSQLLNSTFTKLLHGMFRGVKGLYGVVLVAERSYSEGDNMDFYLLLLVFSPWTGLGRAHTSVRRLVWLWYTASWECS